MSSRTTAYYDSTAHAYEVIHGDDPTHLLALERSWPILQELSITSVLEVGCGTGRSLKWLRGREPSLHLFGIDPSQSLLTIAKAAVPEATLTSGTGEYLPHADNSVDLAVATGIMHHVDRPSAVIAEMFRVARKAILISDHNNFAFGGFAARRIRMALHLCGLLELATFVKQGFKRQGYSEDDGWWYPYSLLNNHSDIARFSDVQYLITTRPINTEQMSNLVFDQSHFAVVAIKRADRAGGRGAGNREQNVDS